MGHGAAQAKSTTRAASRRVSTMHYYSLSFFLEGSQTLSSLFYYLLILKFKLTDIKIIYENNPKVAVQANTILITTSRIIILFTTRSAQNISCKTSSTIQEHEQNFHVFYVKIKMSQCLRYSRERVVFLRTINFTHLNTYRRAQLREQHWQARATATVAPPSK